MWAIDLPVSLIITLIRPKESECSLKWSSHLPVCQKNLIMAFFYVYVNVTQEKTPKQTFKIVEPKKIKERRWDRIH